MMSRMSKMSKNLLSQVGLIMFIVMLLMLSAVKASAQDTVMRRYALYVGSNYGGHERVTLSYAVTDARTVSEVMQQLGGVMPTDSVILTDPSPRMVNHTISEIKKSIRAEDAKRTEFFFYYSGHSDEQGLLLGDTTYKYEDLKDAIDSVSADVNIAVLDSCSSGAFTRMKGGIRRSPFLSDDSVDASGHAFLTSSSEDEAAQESDDLGGSFFTHYFVTALRGAADSTLDGTVSLNEAYSYASAETLARTEDTLAGPQHPSYDIQLAGTGDLVLTDLRSVSEQIMFEEGLRGRIFVRDSAGRLVVELKKIEGTPVAVSIGPGRYSMILDDGDQLLSADLMLSGGAKVLVLRDEFYPVPRSVNQTRGGTLVAADDGRSVDKPASGDESDTAAELDVIAERARKRALEAAGMSEDADDGPAYITSSSYEDSLKNGEETAPDSRQSVINGDNGLSFGFVADSYHLDGIQVGIIGANNEGVLDGIQVASVFAANDGDVNGVQLSGVWNSAEGDVRGAQVAGVWNKSDEVRLAQISGVFNVAEGHVRGVQTSGVFNIAEQNVYGAQLSGVFNTAGNVYGAQFSSVVNVAEEVKGAQVGLMNFGGDVSGVQIGLINISEDLHGIPVGLINISKNGLRDLSFWYSDNNMFNFGYQFGTSTVYSFVTAGFSENWSDAATAGVGLGLELGGDVFFFDTEIHAKAYQAGRGDAFSNLQGIFSGAADIFPAARLSAGIELFDFLGFFAGVNLDCSISGMIDGVNIEIGEAAAASYGVEPISAVGPEGGVEIYPSWFIGVRI